MKVNLKPAICDSAWSYLPIEIKPSIECSGYVSWLNGNWGGKRKHTVMITMQKMSIEYIYIFIQRITESLYDFSVEQVFSEYIETEQQSRCTWKIKSSPWKNVPYHLFILFQIQCVIQPQERTKWKLLFCNHSNYKRLFSINLPNEEL